MALLDQADPSPVTKKVPIGSLLGRMTKSNLRHVILEDVYLYNTRIYQQLTAASSKSGSEKERDKREDALATEIKPVTLNETPIKRRQVTEKND